jgi:uncharacterized membrane protein YebE (DUF533 family)
MPAAALCYTAYHAYKNEQEAQSIDSPSEHAYRQTRAKESMNQQEYEKWLGSL